TQLSYTGMRHLMTGLHSVKPVAVRVLKYILFSRLQKWGLNTYLYTPKDDFKHRISLCSFAEQLMIFICAANKHGMKFIYAISPRLDVTFSNHREVSTLKRKLDKVPHFGCKCFALFNDINHNICPADKEVFSSFTHAQVSVTNELFQYLREPETFLFCPTEYCGTFWCPSVSQSSYLRTIGEKLLPGIEVLWTRPKVVSKEITVESIKEVSKILKRSPVIWDNIHDYDQKRLFLGPYKGWSTELIPRIRGVLTNPNCEFETYFVAIHTLATWYKSNIHVSVCVQIKLENEGSDEELETDIAMVSIIAHFLSGPLHVPHSGGENCLAHVTFLATPSLSPSTMVTTVFQQPIVSPVLESSGEPHLLPKEDLNVQVETEKREADEEPMEMVEEKHDLYGKDVRQITTEMVRAKIMEELKPMDKDSLGEVRDPEALIQEDTANDVASMQIDEQMGREPYVPSPKEKPLFMMEGVTLEDLSLLVELFYLPYEHGSRRFEEMGCSIIQMFIRLSNSPKRTIIYDLILCVSFYSYWIDSGQWCRSQPSAQFLGRYQEAWAFRGDLVGEFQRLLPIDGANDLFFQPPPTPPTSKIYSIKAYFPKDEPTVYNICTEIYNAGLDGLPFSEQEPDLIGKMMLNSHEEEKVVLPDCFLSNFPSLLKVDIHTKVFDPSVPKSLMGCLLYSLKANGSHGAFCEVRQTDKRMLDFYSKLGCSEGCLGFP
uniref:protein O-GlcNAcase n=1 Tax=Scleropages formosus TaxID=113540 RepID=A0A8C9S148_SCLFO